VIDLIVTSDNLDALVEGYFTHYRRLFSSERSERLAAQDVDPLSVWLMIGGPIPDIAWDVVVALLYRAPDEDALAFAIAGPLRDLVTGYGQQFADPLVERCRHDGEFRRCMTTVYRLQGVPPALQARLGAGSRVACRPKHPAARRLGSPPDSPPDRADRFRSEPRYGWESAAELDEGRAA
jgi:hypothetical protein